MSDTDQKQIVLSAEGISKFFGSVVALNNVSLDVYEDEVVGLVGDNGAGKSTLVKILSGNFPPDKGVISLDGKKINFKSPSDARSMGIETVYQDLALCEQLDAVSNLFIGRELYRTICGFQVLQNKEMERVAVEVLGKIGTNFPSVREKVAYMSGGQRQAVALGRFIAWGKRLILLDEPTAALGIRETGHVLDLVAKTRKEKGVSMILISHNLQHVFQIADRIIVMRLGEIVGIREKKNTTPDEIVSMITGAILVNQEVKEGLE
jgi:ABC-type sugar transport system, ATPase component